MTTPTPSLSPAVYCCPNAGSLYCSCDPPTQMDDGDHDRLAMILAVAHGLAKLAGDIVTPSARRRLAEAAGHTLGERFSEAAGLVVSVRPNHRQGTAFHYALSSYLGELYNLQDPNHEY